MSQAIPRSPSSCRRVVLATCLMLVAHRPPGLAAQRPATWTIDATPTLVLGRGSGSGEQFSAVAGAARLPGGGILVGDRGEYALRLFDARGKLLRQQGRKGKGPGEVDFLASFLRCGDRVATLDFSGDRVSIFTLDAVFVRSFRFAETPYRTACNARGEFVVEGVERDKDMKATASRPPVPYWITDTSGGTRATLGVLPGAERIGNMPLLLGRDPRVAFGRDRAYIALADSLVVLAFDRTGRRLAPLQGPTVLRRANAAERDAEIERMVITYGESFRKGMEQMYRDVALPRFLPATRDLLVDADDNVWVQHFPSTTRATVQWTVFSPAGRHLADVQLPTAFELFEAGRDYVLGRYLDPDEAIPEVRLYRLTR